MDEQWVLFIDWRGDGVFVSPPVGPYHSYTSARKEATRVRKRLRANGRKGFKVEVSVLRTPRFMWGWSDLHDPDTATRIEEGALDG
jgi:hypothetical protein